MILFLRGLFIVILASMLAVTSWAGLRCPLFAVPREVFTHPWFLATLADAYAGFATFFVWACYKQNSWYARVAWFVAIMLLGNIAISACCLDEIFRTSRAGRISELLVARRGGSGGLGLALTIAGLAAVALALVRG